MTIPSDPSDRISPQEPLTPGRPAIPSQPGQFESHMGGKAPSSMPTTTPNAVNSPMSLSQSTPVQSSVPSLDTLSAQVGTAQESMATAKNRLQTPNLQLTRSQQHLLRNKLTDANTHIQAANTRLGIPAEKPPSSAGNGPLGRLLGYMSHGEQLLGSAQETIGNMRADGGNINPADFLLVQVKLNQAQQEIEYSSALLGKAVDSLKRMMETPL